MCQTLVSIEHAQESDNEGAYVVLCASGFDFPQRMRSALMFASLAAAADMHAVLFCVQNAVDVMVRGAIAAHEQPETGVPSLLVRLQEAMAVGVQIQCCTQTMQNKGVSPEDLLEGVVPIGAMSLIALTSKAKGSVCF